MLTTYFVGLFILALLIEAGGHLQRQAVQNRNDTTLLRKRSNLTEDAALVARNPFLGKLFWPSPPALPISHHMLHQPVKLERKSRFLLVPMDIGMPVQHLKVVLATDSSCLAIHSSSWLSITRKYVKTGLEPNSYHCRFGFRDYPGSHDVVVKGDLYMDQIRVGTVEQRAMMLYLDRRATVDGILGLSFAQEYPLPSNNPPKDMAFVPNVLGKTFPHPVFALYLVGNSELHMGEPLPAYYEKDSIEYHKLTKPPVPQAPQRWQIGSAVIGVNNDEELIPRFETVFDTTAKHIIGPMEMVKKIDEKLWEPNDNRKYPENDVFPCGKQVELYLRWNGGRKWTISQDM